MPHGACNPRVVLKLKPVEPSASRDHPFATYIRTVGRGEHLSRPLDEAEAEAAMAMILAGEAEPVQVGAFLLVLRYRRETPEELAGFVRAARARMAISDGLTADLDWPSYADRHRQLPYFVLAALLLAENGVRVAMHGLAGVGSATTPLTLRALGIEPARSMKAAAKALDKTGFAYLPIELICPDVARLFDLRPILGVRSPANSLARELNPLGAACQIQGVFHPTFLPVHREAASHLGQPRAAIFKGGGGEAQRNPEKPCRVATVGDGDTGEETWPALSEGQRHAWREETLDPAATVALWRGERDAPGPEAAVVGTAAMALKLLGRADTQNEAQTLAENLWRERSRHKFD